MDSPPISPTTPRPPVTMSRSGSAEMRDPPRIQHIKVDSSKRLEEDYELGRKLGEGTFGVVSEAEDIKEKTRWAVKKLQKERGSSNSNNAKSWEREVHILKLVRHENVVSLRVIYESDHHVYMIMELCDGGNLNTELNRRGRFSEPEARELMRQLGAAIDYLHRRNIVHRDVKLENLLIQNLANASSGSLGAVSGETSDPAEGKDSAEDQSLLPYRIKLTDFGLSIELKKSQETMQEFCGTPLYMAPEIIAGKSYSRQCDVWSVGIIMHQLLTGASPFRATTEEDLYDEIREWEDTNIELSPKLKSASVSEDAIVTMRRLLHREPMHRYTSKEAIRQNWFTGATEPLEGGATTNILELMKEFNRAKENGENISGDSLLSPSNGSETAGGATASASPGTQKRAKQPGNVASTSSDRRRSNVTNSNRRSNDSSSGRK